MITITLPDGSRREFENPVSVLQVAQSIGAGLAKAAVAVEVDAGEGFKAQDLSAPIERDVKLKIATGKDALGLEVTPIHLLP